MDLGYTKITLQIGSGDHTPDTTPPLTGLGVSWFRYKPTLATDMSEADLIISHGGIVARARHMIGCGSQLA